MFLMKESKFQFPIIFHMLKILYFFLNSWCYTKLPTTFFFASNKLQSYPVRWLAQLNHVACGSSVCQIVYVMLNVLLLLSYNKSVSKKTKT